MDKIISVKSYLLRLGLVVSILVMLGLLGLFNLVALSSPVEAQTTANITITITPGVIGISCNVSTYAVGTVYTGTSVNTSTTVWAKITNSSTVVTNHSIGVTGATWTGGATAWTHSPTATPGADTIGMNANKGGTWGTGDVIVKSSALNNIATNQAASTDYTFGISILMPTSTTVNDQKTNVLQIIVSAS